MTTLFKALAAAAQQHMNDFNSQELANTAFAFATGTHYDKQLFTGLAAAAQQCMKDFNSQDLANKARAMLMRSGPQLSCHPHQLLNK